jgi:mannosyltransferase OCH1-like enzyme
MTSNIFDSVSFFTGIKKDELDKKKVIEKVIEFKKKMVPFVRKESYKSIIPLKIFTCWHTKDLPPFMKKNMDNLKASNPEFKLYVYEENACRNFIRKNFHKDVLDAYDSLKPCSYKSDLWRFCNLYIKGGIYVDIKYRCVNNFKLIALTEKEYFVRDRGEYGVYTALIVSRPKNKILWDCIQKIVEHVKTNYYGSNALDPTGPGLLGSFFSREEINNMELYFEHTDINNYYKDLYYIMYNDRIILAYYNQYREEQKNNQKFDHYSVLWDKKDIYVI